MPNLIKYTTLAALIVSAATCATAPPASADAIRGMHVIKQASQKKRPTIHYGKAKRGDDAAATESSIGKRSLAYTWTAYKGEPTGSLHGTYTHGAREVRFALATFSELVNDITNGPTITSSVMREWRGDHLTDVKIYFSKEITPSPGATPLRTSFAREVKHLPDRDQGNGMRLPARADQSVRYQKDLGDGLTIEVNMRDGLGPKGNLVEKSYQVSGADGSFIQIADAGGSVVVTSNLARYPNSAIHAKLPMLVGKLSGLKSADRIRTFAVIMAAAHAPPATTAQP